MVECSIICVSIGLLSRGHLAVITGNLLWCFFFSQFALWWDESYCADQILNLRFRGIHSSSTPLSQLCYRRTTANWERKTCRQRQPRNLGTITCAPLYFPVHYGTTQPPTSSTPWYAGTLSGILLDACQFRRTSHSHTHSEINLHRFNYSHLLCSMNWYVLMH